MAVGELCNAILALAEPCNAKLALAEPCNAKLALAEPCNARACFKAGIIWLSSSGCIPSSKQQHPLSFMLKADYACAGPAILGLLT